MGYLYDIFILIEDYANSYCVIILMKCGNMKIFDEVKHCLNDAICVIRNIIKNKNVIGGGGLTQLACTIAVKNKPKIKGVSNMPSAVLQKHYKKSLSLSQKIPAILISIM